MRERHFGEWEGLRWEQVLERFPGAGSGDWSTWYRRTPDGGEPFEALHSRLRDALSDASAGAHERVLIVSHAGALRIALGILLGAEGPDVEIALEPASLTRVQIDPNGATLLALNDVSHL